MKTPFRDGLVAGGMSLSEAADLANKLYTNIGNRLSDLQNLKDLDFFIGTLDMAENAFGLSDKDFARAAGKYSKTVSAWRAKTKAPSGTEICSILSYVSSTCKEATGVEFAPIDLYIKLREEMLVEGMDADAKLPMCP